MSKAVIVGCLRAVPLFGDLSDEELDGLAVAARSQVVRRGARLFEEGADADACFVLTSGVAHIVLVAGTGEEVLLDVLRPTSLVGDIALLDRATRSASVVAIEDCHVIRLPAPAFERLRANAGFERRLVAHVVSILRDTNDRVRALTTLSSTGRVAWCLARLARQEGRRDGSFLVIARQSQQQLADMSACTRETVNRALSELKRRNHVIADETSMRLDVDGLQRYLKTDLRLPQ
jgi:CRP/FNR family transcriptional regulator